MKIAHVAATTLLSLIAGFASADNFQINAGSITSDIMNPYAHTFMHEVGSFTDTIDFTIPSGSLGSAANSFTLTLGNVNIFSITGLTYSVYGGTSASSGPLYASYIGDNTSNDLPLTMAGAYHILVNGVADGSHGGSYGISLVSSVPEPGTYIMMMAGLGLVGLIARRKKNLS